VRCVIRWSEQSQHFYVLLVTLFQLCWKAFTTSGLDRSECLRRITLKTGPLFVRDVQIHEFDGSCIRARLGVETNFRWQPIGRPLAAPPARTLGPAACNARLLTTIDVMISAHKLSCLSSQDNNLPTALVSTTKLRHGVGRSRGGAAPAAAERGGRSVSARVGHRHGGRQPQPALQRQGDPL